MCRWSTWRTAGAARPWLIPSAGTSQPVRVELNNALSQAMNIAALQGRMSQEDFEPGLDSPAQRRTRLDRELPQQAKLVKERGITTE